MITKDELETGRTPKELSEFVSQIFDQIRADDAQVKLARTRQGTYKEFIEEVYPLSIFLSCKYGDDCLYKCRPVLGNQGYDAVVEADEGKLIENVAS